MKNKFPLSLSVLTLTGLLMTGCASGNISSEDLEPSADAPSASVSTTPSGSSSATPEATSTPEAKPTGTVSQGPTASPDLTQKATGPDAPATATTPSEDGDAPSGTASTTEERFTNTTEGDLKLTNNIPLKGTSKNEHGVYAQTTVRPDKEYMSFSEATASEELKKALKDKAVTVEEVETIQRQVMTFVAEEGLDSELNGGKDVGSWWKANKDKMHRDFADKIKKDLESKDGGTFLVRASTDAPYFYSADHARLTTRDMSLQNVKYAKAGEYTALLFTVDFSMAMPVKGDSGADTTHLTSGTLTYSMVKDGKTWKFGEWNNSYQTKQIQG